ncbi:hypothetical protein M2137_002658 [Parabacteroides sp. PFB2-10]|nr:hypothetical protein [Parabacteroides sp. PFB2-10]
MKYSYILFLFVCISCSYSERGSSLDKLKKLNNTKISSSILECDSMILSDYLVEMINDKLIVQNFKTDHAFTIFAMNGNKLVKENDLIRIGNGPYEMVYPSCFVDKATQDIYFYDSKDNSVDYYKINAESSNLYQKENWTKFKSSSFNDYFLGTNGGFATMGDSAYVIVGGGLDKTNMLSVVHKEKDIIIDTNASFPEDNCYAEIITKRVIYNNGGIRSRGIGNQYLYYGWSGNYAEIFSFKNVHEVSRKSVVNDFTIYTTSDDGMNPKGDIENLRGLKAYTTNKYIYLMPYPLRNKDFIDKNDYKGYPNFYNEDIFVFDWEGNFVKSYTLDKLINTFVISEDDSSLFGITADENGEYQILKCNLD